MHLEQSANTTDINRTLNQLSLEVRSERLDFALPLIESMRVSFALNRTMGDTPPGTLTVEGWMGLLNRWERVLEEMPPRRIHFASDFFREVLEQGRLGSSPVVAILEQLLTVMIDRKTEETRQAA